MKNKKTDNRVALMLVVILIFICIAALTLGSAEMNLQSLLGGILKKDGFATESTILYSLPFRESLQEHLPA